MSKSPISEVHCLNCMFLIEDTAKNPIYLGTCHRYPPSFEFVYGLVLGISRLKSGDAGDSAAQQAENLSVWNWPRIFGPGDADLWCGEFQPKRVT
jgi:hypothetical protein